MSDQNSLFSKQDDEEEEEDDDEDMDIDDENKADNKSTKKNFNKIQFSFSALKQILIAKDVRISLLFKIERLNFQMICMKEF